MHFSIAPAVLSLDIYPFPPYLLSSSKNSESLLSQLQIRSKKIKNFPSLRERRYNAISARYAQWSV